MKQELRLKEWTGLDRKRGALEDIWYLGEESAVYDFEHTMDLRQFDGVALTIGKTGRTDLWLTITLKPLASGRPEFIGQTSARICLPPEGGHIEAAFSLFDHSRIVNAHMKYISSMELTLTQEGQQGEAACLKIESVALVQSGDFHASAEKPSLTGKAGEEFTYRILLENERETERIVTAASQLGGRESIPFAWPEKVILAPGEKRVIEVTARIGEAIPAGGFEKRILEWIPDGNSSLRQSTVLYAARRIQHPFLLHKESGWRRLREQIGKNCALRKRFEEEYVQKARDWCVPEPAAEKGYVYVSASQDLFLAAAIAWKVTGERSFFHKILKYMKGFLEEERGYLSTEYSYFQFIESQEEYRKGTFPVHRACSAGWVQEGEFMNKMAVVYDLVYDEPEFTLQMHEQMERCMRNYMDFTSWRLTDGDGNNFQLAEASAALYFACLLQDCPMIERFLSGSNGLYELIGSVFSDDGSYFEGASGYMRLAAEILLHTANACENFGLNFKDVIVPASYDRFVIHAPWAVRKAHAADGKPFLGMSFERTRRCEKPVRRLKDYLDNLLLLLTPQGILFSANDSNEQSLSRIMEMADYLYRDPRYLQVVRQEEYRELLFGLHMAEEEPFQAGVKSCLNTGNGYAVLRDQGKSLTQAVLKYGQHGGYHGHYDRLSLVSLIRDGQTFHNQEFAWYGYDSFLFKMWVQTSVAHNMVVVDRKMQEPTACECIYYEDQGSFQAVCAQTVSRWSDPPYGGQTPYPWKFPEEKCEREGRYILSAKEVRRQGEIGEYSEPVFQRRLVVLAEGCCFVWDYEEAQEEHAYDCLYHPLGSMTAQGLRRTGHTDRYDENPYGAAQFVRNCSWYDTEGTVDLRIENHQKRVNPNDIMDFAENVRLFGVFPQKGRMMIGRYPQRKDSFREEEAQEKNLPEDPCKKVVAFRQEGKTARFITALEIGADAAAIREIRCDCYERIVITLQDGSQRELTVHGMDRREEKKITVSYQVR